MLDTRPPAPDRFAARELGLAAGVALVVAAVWGAGLRGPYHYDDYVTPLDDPASRSVAAFGTHLAATLRPVTKLTYALEASLGLGARPAARRAVSVAIHAAGVALLLLLLLELGRGRGRAPAAAVLLALLYGVHPVHAESLLAVAGRTAALSGTLALAALLAHARLRPWPAAVLLAIAALARETALLALLPLACLELAGEPRPWRERLRRLAPALAAALVVAAWLAATPRYRQLADYSLGGRPLVASLVQQVAAVPVGLSLYARPWALAVDHGVPLPTSPAAPLFLAGVALYVAAAVGARAAVRRAPAAAVGLTLWLAALLPTQSVVPKLDPLAERPLGLALAGLLVAASALTTARWRPWARRAAAGAGLVAVALLAAATVARGRLYRSEVALWGAAARLSTASARPHANYARALEAAGCRSAALEAADAALRLAPLDRDAGALRARLARAAPGAEPASCPPARGAR